jgi:DNA-binding CsgD family transcriptional regulator
MSSTKSESGSGSGLLPSNQYFFGWADFHSDTAHPAHVCASDEGTRRYCSLCTKLTACDLLGAGLLVCDRDCRIIGANRSALSILRAGDGLKANARGVLCTTRNDLSTDALLGRMVARALDGEETTAIVVPRSGNAPSLTLIVRETVGTMEIGLAGQPLALVLVIDPAQANINQGVDLQRLYRLTSGEAQLAELLVSGLSLEKSCDELAIPSSRGRDYLRGLFRKTGVRRLRHLVALLQRELRADQQNEPADGFVESLTALDRPH